MYKKKLGKCKWHRSQSCCKLFVTLAMIFIWKRLTYASVVKETNNTNTNESITHKSNSTNAEKESQSLLKKLKTLNPNKWPQSHGKSPSRSTSRIRQEPSLRDKEIENLKIEINFRTVSNQQYHQRQSKKCTDGLHPRRPGHKQYRNNKCAYLYPTSNGNSIGTMSN